MRPSKRWQEEEEEEEEEYIYMFVVVSWHIYICICPDTTTKTEVRYLLRGCAVRRGREGHALNNIKSLDYTADYHMLPIALLCAYACVQMQESRAEVR